jgi:hypothetical protein
MVTIDRATDDGRSGVDRDENVVVGWNHVLAVAGDTFLAKEPPL